MYSFAQCYLVLLAHYTLQASLNQSENKINVTNVIDDGDTQHPHDKTDNETEKGQYILQSLIYGIHNVQKMSSIQS